MLTHELTQFLAIGAPGPMELFIILAIGLLLFGKRLPEIARNLGKGVVEFKKGLKNIEEDIDHADQQQYQPPPPPPEKGSLQREPREERGGGQGERELGLVPAAGNYAVRPLLTSCSTIRCRRTPQPRAAGTGCGRGLPSDGKAFTKSRR